MKNVFKFLALGLALVLIATALPASTNAQGGGVIIEATFGTGPNVLEPLFCNDTACARVVGLMFPGMVGTDPKAQNVVMGAPAAISESWEVSEGGRVVTFKLRQDRKWTDGTPITTKDFLYSWDIIKNPDAGSALQFYTSLVENVEAVDDYTLKVTLQVADCTAVSTAGGIPAVPSHIYSAVAPADLRAAAFVTAPTVSAGVYNFSEFRAGETTNLVANPDYVLGAPKTDGFIYKVVPDQTVLVEQFLAGELNVMDGAPVNRRADVKAQADAGQAQVYDFPGNSWDYLALNFADPTNPQPGLNEAGEVVDQGKHPLFSDPKVRKAIALAIDVDAIIKGAVFGEGARMASNMIPSSWAVDPNLAPLPFDPDAAKALLAEAGWTPGSDGILTKDGVRFSFTLYTNQGNTRREAIGTITKDYLAQVGIEVDFQAIDFNVLVDRLRSQTFDAVILGWRNGYPDDPDQTTLFTPAGDIPGGGQNNMSYNNPRVTELMAQALSLPGCDQGERAKLYHEIQKILQEDLPYIPLFVINGQYAAKANVQGFAPEPNELYWNVETWTIAQ
ncbi:MAG: peptide-binding protein [Anaerolineae bacterium]